MLSYSYKIAPSYFRPSFDCIGLTSALSDFTASDFTLRVSSFVVLDSSCIASTNCSALLELSCSS